MITYEYECSECSANFDVRQSIKDDAFTVCPECNKATLSRVLHSPIYVRVLGGDPTTIGQLAERNAKKMSVEEMDRAQERYKTAKTINRVPEDRRPKSQPTVKPKDMPEWMTKPRTKTTADVVKMTPEQTKKYIQTGE
jgi:putative FmdB family regulatory protein